MRNLRMTMDLAMTLIINNFLANVAQEIAVDIL